MPNLLCIPQLQQVSMMTGGLHQDYSYFCYVTTEPKYHRRCCRVFRSIEYSDAILAVLDRTILRYVEIVRKSASDDARLLKEGESKESRAARHAAQARTNVVRRRVATDMERSLARSGEGVFNIRTVAELPYLAPPPYSVIDSDDELADFENALKTVETRKVLSNKLVTSFAQKQNKVLTPKEEMVMAEIARQVIDEEAELWKNEEEQLDIEPKNSIAGATTETEAKLRTVPVVLTRPENEPHAKLGLGLERTAYGIRITKVSEGSLAAVNHIKVGMVLAAVNGIILTRSATKADAIKLLAGEENTNCNKSVDLLLTMREPNQPRAWISSMTRAERSSSIEGLPDGHFIVGPSMKTSSGLALAVVIAGKVEAKAIYKNEVGAYHFKGMLKGFSSVENLIDAARETSFPPIPKLIFEPPLEAMVKVGGKSAHDSNGGAFRAAASGSVMQRLHTVYPIEKFDGFGSSGKKHNQQDIQVSEAPIPVTLTLQMRGAKHGTSGSIKARSAGFTLKRPKNAVDHEGHPIISSVKANTAASEAGVVPGMILLAVNDQNVEGISNVEIGQILKSKPEASIFVTPPVPLVNKSGPIDSTFGFDNGFDEGIGGGFGFVNHIDVEENYIEVASFPGSIPISSTYFGFPTTADVPAYHDSIEGDEIDVDQLFYSKENETETFTDVVSFDASANLGFSFSKFSSGFKVTKLTPGGQAEVSGKVKIGMYIIKVGEVSVTGFTEKSEVSNQIKLLKANGYVSISVTFTGTRVSKETPKISTVKLNKNGNKLGIAFGVDKSGQNPAVITKISEDGIAAQSGRLSIGMIISAINGKRTQGLSKPQVAKLFNESETLMLEVVELKQQTSSLLHEHESQKEVYGNVSAFTKSEGNVDKTNHVDSKVLYNPPVSTSVEDQPWSTELKKTKAEELLNGKPPGTFVVRKTTLATSGWGITYVGKEDEVKNVMIHLFEGGPQVQVGKTGGVPYENVVALVDAACKRKQKGINVKLILPLLTSKVTSVSSADTLIKSSPVSELPTWLVDLDRAAAVAKIKDKGDGAFVVRPSKKASSGHCLTYLKDGAILNVLITESNEGFSLKAGEDPHRAPSLASLIEWHMMNEGDIGVKLNMRTTKAAVPTELPESAEASKYSTLGRLTLVKECQSRGIDTSAVGKDVSLIRSLLEEDDALKGNQLQRKGNDSSIISSSIPHKPLTSSQAPAELSNKYSGVGRLALVKQCRERGLPFETAGRDISKLIKLLTDEDAKTGGTDHYQTAASVLAQKRALANTPVTPPALAPKHLAVDEVLRIDDESQLAGMKRLQLIQLLRKRGIDYSSARNIDGLRSLVKSSGGP